MQEKQLTITEWLAIAIEQIEKRNLIGARQIYSGIVGSIPDHKKAKPGLLAVTDALDCDYFPIFKALIGDSLQSYTKLQLTFSATYFIYHIFERHHIANDE